MIRTLLNELACQAHAAQPDLVGTADVPEVDLVGRLMRLSQNPDVKPARLVEYLSQRAGLLLSRGVKVLNFPHRTFQEYLAACYLTDHDYPGKKDCGMHPPRAGTCDPTSWTCTTMKRNAAGDRGPYWLENQERRTNPITLIFTPNFI